MNEPEPDAAKPGSASAPNSPSPTGISLSRKPRVTGTDREFLPAALEILETPPAPRNVAFMLAICAFVTTGLAWSFFGKLDVHATAWGKIEALGGSKVVQPLEPGKIAAILVGDGAEVNAGELLVALDDAEPKADAAAAHEAYAAMRAEVARRRASVQAAQAILMGRPNAADIAFEPNTPDNIRLRERNVFEAERRFIADSMISFDRQIAQQTASLQRLEMSINNQLEAIRTSEERVSVREASIRLNVGTKISLFDARESLQRSQTQLAIDRGQQLEVRAAIAEIESQRNKLISNATTENEAKLAEAARRADELAHQKAKADARLARTRLTAPIDGVVQQMSIATIGQVVTTGQQLMTIAPRGKAIQVEVFVANADIGFVHAGQRAEVKIDAFPFTRFGTIPAKVVRIGIDALEEHEARRRIATATASALPQTSAGGMPGQPQVFVFPVRLELERATIDAQGRQAPLIPGMTVVAEVKTDRRRVIDYLLSPIAKVASEAMRER